MITYHYSLSNDELLKEYEKCVITLSSDHITNDFNECVKLHKLLNAELLERMK
jgi:hypothetical protein